jgi:glycosyltransferase involved in cell wall biosynthesis
MTAGRGALQVSVVVPTYRRPELLSRCLDALLAQTLPPEAYEIVVVDDGHQGATREIVQALAQRPAAPALHCLWPASGRGPAVARNTGWRSARAPLVAFTDDDTVPAPGWLAAGVAAMRAHPDWIALAGRVVVPLHHPRRPRDHERMTQGLETAEFVTANAFVRRTALMHVGGFDERFTAAWREDADLQFRLMDVGVIGRADAARVVHPVRAERWGVSLRQQRNVYFDALLFGKHRRRYRERIRRVPPWDYYAVVLATIAALLFAATAQASAAGAAAAVAALLVLRLAWRRLRGADHSPGHVGEMLATSTLIPYLSVYWRLRGALHFRVPFW